MYNVGLTPILLLAGVSYQATLLLIFLLRLAGEILQNQPKVSESQASQISYVTPK